MQCNYCHAWEQRDEYDKFLTLEQLENGVSFIKTLIKDYQHLAVHFNGDDVFLDWSTIKSFIERNSKEMTISIHSNGVLLFPERIDFLKSHNVRILLSLDGPKEVQDINRCFKNGKSSFDFIYNRLKLLKEKQAKFTVVATFNKASISKIYESYLFLMNEKIPFSFLFDTKFSSYDLVEINSYFELIAKDFALRTPEERMCFRDYYRGIHPNNEAYYFSINLHTISMNFNKHTFKAFADFHGNEIKIHTNEEIEILPRVKAKCACNKGDECLTCPAFVPGGKTKTRYNLEIYCLLLKSIFREMKEKNVWTD